MKKFLNILKKALPWMVAAGIFTYLFRQYRPSQILIIMKHANMLYFLVLGLIYFSLLYIVDCYSMSKVLTRFGFPIEFKKLLPARGVTYLIMNINYPASQAAFAYYLKRVHKIPIIEVLSVFFFIAIVDLFILLSLAFAGSFFQDSVINGVHIDRYIQTVVLIAYVCFVLQFAFWRGWLTKALGIKKDIKIFEWLRSKKIFLVFNEAKFSDYFKVALVRSPIHASIVLFLYIAVQAFHAFVPLINVISSVPIAFLIGTVPITPAGLGTTNIALIEFLSPHITSGAIANGIMSAGELIFAVTILWMVMNTLLKVLTGIVWLQKVSKRLFEPTKDANQEEVMSEATHLMGDI